jgi:signal recognition particle subunit SRP54
MGDVLTLIEKAEAAFDEKEAEEAERKMRKGQFTFEDFLKQMRAVKRMGSFGGLLSMLPGIPKEIKDVDIDDKQIARIEAIILSMTPAERNDPSILNASRRQRIAAGSGVDVQAVNALVKQFEEMRKMMKSMLGGGRMPDLSALGSGGAPGMPGLGGNGQGLPGGGFSHGGSKAKRKKKRR